MGTHPKIADERFSDQNFSVTQPVCKQTYGYCGQIDCANNNGEGDCSKTPIFVTESLISHKFVCKSYSVKKLSGHRDWSRNLDSTGHAKGGNIPDKEANSYKRKKQF